MGNIPKDQPILAKDPSLDFQIQTAIVFRVKTQPKVSEKSIC
jgi:hypothetical protein